jgi:RNA polymerase subunit RPABC4/transcription elongation factor Spt4
LQIFLAAVVLIYSSCLIWITRDIKNRTNNFLIQISSIILGLLFIPGLIIYLLLRPRETVDEKKSRNVIRKIELVAIESKLRTCSHCTTLNKMKFKYCVNCGTELKSECKECSKLIDPLWQFCPFCSTEILKEQGQFLLLKYINMFISNIYLNLGKVTLTSPPSFFSKLSKLNKTATGVLVRAKKHINNPGVKSIATNSWILFRSKMPTVKFTISEEPLKVHAEKIEGPDTEVKKSKKVTG